MIKFPIIIISSPRSGSTPLAYDLKNKYKVELFNEPFGSPPGGTARPKISEQKQLLSLVKNNKNKFILKLHIADLKAYPKEIIRIIETHNCHLIRIRRKDIVSQCTSLYIEIYRNVWGYYKNFISENEIANLSDTELPINQDNIEECIDRISRLNNKLNKINYMIDQDVWYEDLSFDETFIKTPRPKNYNTIKENIEKIL